MWYAFIACVSELHKRKSYCISTLILWAFVLLFVNCGKLHSDSYHVCYLEWFRDFYLVAGILFCFQSISQLFVYYWISFNYYRCCSSEYKFILIQIDFLKLFFHSLRIKKEPRMKTRSY